MFDKLGGRKVLITVICLAAGVAIDLLTQRGLSENLLYLMIAVISIYTTGNVFNKQVLRPKGVNPKQYDQAILGMDTRVQQLEQYASGLNSHLEESQKQIAAMQEQVLAANKRVAAIVNGFGAGE